MATKTSHELTWEAIEQVLQKAIDAYTVEDALRYNSEILDLLAIEMMIIRNSSRSREKNSRFYEKPPDELSIIAI